MNKANDQHDTENELPTQHVKPSSWGKVAAELAYEISILNRGDLATLRRMDPDVLDNAVVWRLLAQTNPHLVPKAESKWGLVAHGIALMTQTGGADAASRTAHNPKMSVGKALFYGGDLSRTMPFYGERRFNCLLSARGPILRTLMARVFRMMGNTGQSFDWREMARWILSEEYDPVASEKMRRRIARNYFWEENAASKKRQTQD